MYLCTCFRDIVSSALSSSLDAPMACTYVHALGVLFHRLFRARWGHPMPYIFYTRFRVWIHFVAECDSSPRGELLTERLRAPEEWLYLQWLFATFQSSHPRNGSMKVVRPPPWFETKCNGIDPEQTEVTGANIRRLCATMDSHSHL